ncbi:hypothetical protein [Helicobacter sp. MIT 11-5569]|nr:hypothetical protein [Helicobacter sp. MIT 11-5569]
MKKIFLSLSLIAMVFSLNACSTKSKIDRKSPCACFEIEKMPNNKG